MLARKALAGTAGAPKVYVEDVFSTYLYTGNASTKTITNGIDLSGEGGLVWYKARNQAYNHGLQDTARGTGVLLISNSTGGDVSVSNYITSFNSDGFTAGDGGNINASSTNYASWTFRKAEKFFDIVTYTGDNTSSKAISHNLGSVPGCVIVKRTDSASHWFVWHRSTSGTPNNDYTLLNQTAATAVATDAWSSNAFTSTQFYVSNNLSTNVSGATYVAYLFAHDAGGFGLTGSDNVISCGSFTTDGSGNATVSLGYEPQWMITKASTQAENWYINDVMRGYYAPSQGAISGLSANTSNAESGTRAQYINATGFTVVGGLSASQTYIYIAIRRGPMKTPTTGTSVFSPITYAGNSTASRVISGLINAPDLVLYTARDAGAGLNSHITGSRLQGGGRYLLTEDASSEASSTAYGVQTYGQTSVTLGTATTSEQNASGVNYILYGMGRAPGFFDVVCYTGTGSARTVSHNLGVAPELIIVKRRNSSTYGDWYVYNASQGATKFLLLNLTDAVATNSGPWNNTAPTSSVFTAGSDLSINSTATYVAYLFASLSGVSKIGTYTGNGSSVTVTTDFQPRFILVKRTDSTGDWIVSDSARGLVAGNDPYLDLNTADAEVTNEDWVDISSTSFTVNQTTNNANVNTGTYIYLAIA